MYNVESDHEDVKEISCNENFHKPRYPLRVLSSTQSFLLNQLFSFIYQGNTFRDTGYRNKIEIVGNRINCTEYAIPVSENFKRKEVPRVEKGKSESLAENSQKSARRAKGVFIDKLDSTFAWVDKKFPKLFEKGWRLRHLTLTYRADMEDRNQLAQDWAKFEKRVKDYFVRVGLCSEEELKSIHYAAVPEIQKERERKSGKKVWHIHILIFSPYLSLREIYKVWGLGGIKPQKVAIEKVKALGGYLAKYMQKDFEAGALNKKRFFTSRNVRNYKIRWVQNVKNIQEVISSFRKYAIEEKTFSYLSEHLGMVSGCVLLLSRTDEVYQFLQFLTG